MKISKYIWILFVVTSIISCKKDDDGGSVFLLTNDNIAGTHSLSYLRINIHQVIVVNGIEITSNIAAVGSTFQVAFDFAANGTYTAEGEFLMTTTTNVAGQSNVETEIIVLNESGTYQVDTQNNTISIMGSDLLESTFDVTVFDQNAMTWIQERTENNSDGVADLNSEIRFQRD